ncbi:hypothetical protein CgunFtcFv8_014025 [Champsocephalus gunnari]|uniref:Uncharacterized protein n=1 Tax=Champsocephalus gunnari TaxID=52237 RepID=A0AAN8E577_CHAGU|nr:hypothetical protein CgunFtcFv8_014025 [Champsocephalus gunnari]
MIYYQRYGRHKKYDVVAHLQFGRTPDGQGGTPAPRAGRADRLLRPQRQDQTLGPAARESRMPTVSAEAYRKDYRLSSRSAWMMSL